MGEFRKYRPYYALNALRFNGGAFNNNSYSSYYYAYDNSKTRVPNFKDIAGIEYGWLKNLASYVMYSVSSNRTITVSGIENTYVRHGEWLGYQYQPFIYLTPFATSDKLSNYSVDDYEYATNLVGITYFQRSHYVAKDVNKILYSMSIFNNNVDSYASNDDPTFVANTFYSLVDENYILLTECPSDWITNYTEYYKLVPAKDINVSCIKFRAPMLADSSTDRTYVNARATESAYSSLGNSNYNGIVPIFALLCAYFLDEEVTIHPGDSYLLSLSFESSQF